MKTNANMGLFHDKVIPKILQIVSTTKAAFRISSGVSQVPTVLLKAQWRKKNRKGRWIKELQIMWIAKAIRALHNRASMPGVHGFKNLQGVRPEKTDLGVCWSNEGLQSMSPRMESKKTSRKICEVRNKKENTRGKFGVVEFGEIKTRIQITQSPYAKGEQSNNERGGAKSLWTKVLLLRRNGGDFLDLGPRERRRRLPEEGVRKIGHLETRVSNGVPGFLSSAVLQLQRRQIPERWSMST